MPTPDKIIETELYYFDNLSDEAKETAIEWYRSTGGDNDYDYVLEDIDLISELFGLELAYDKVRKGNHILFSDHGAMFKGSYSYKKGGLVDIKKHAPTDEVLHDIVKDLVYLQKRHGYGLETDISTVSTRYPSSSSQRTETVYCHSGENADEHVDNEMEAIMGRYADWCGTLMNNAIEYTQSDEYIAENITINAWLFTVGGTFSE